MELTALRQLVAIADARHVTRAAEQLGLSQPTLSAMLKRLEAELGAELFHRTGRGVEPTEAGLVLLDHARAAVRQADDGAAAVRRLVGLEQGVIRLGGGATAIGCVLPPAVAAFRRERPGVGFAIREAGSATIAEAVLAGALDLGVVTEPVVVPGADDLMTIARVTDELMLITPRGHELAERGKFTWADLASAPIIGFEAGSSVRRVIDEAASAAGVTLDVVVELRSIEGIERMVAAGVGVGFVSRLAIQPREGGDASAGIACADGPIRRGLAVVRRRDRVPSPAVAAFERLLLAHLAANSPG